MYTTQKKETQTRAAARAWPTKDRRHMAAERSSPLLNFPLIQKFPDFPAQPRWPAKTPKAFGGLIPAGNRMPIQRALKINHTEQSDEYTALEDLSSWFELFAAAPYKELYTTLCESKTVTLVLCFAETDEGTYGYTTIDNSGKRIWLILGNDLLEQDDDEMDTLTLKEGEAKATFIHEFILHCAPAARSMLKGQKADDERGDEEHGDIAGWGHVLATAKEFGPHVLRHSVVDALKHLKFISDKGTFNDMIKTFLTASETKVNHIENEKIVLRIKQPGEGFYLVDTGSALLEELDQEELGIWLSKQKSTTISSGMEQEPQMPNWWFKVNKDMKSYLDKMVI